MIRLLLILQLLATAPLLVIYVVLKQQLQLLLDQFVLQILSVTILMSVLVISVKIQLLSMPSVFTPSMLFVFVTIVIRQVILVVLPRTLMTPTLQVRPCVKVI